MIGCRARGVPGRPRLAGAAGLLVASALFGGSIAIEELPTPAAVPLYVAANGRLLHFADARNPTDATAVPTSFPVYEAFDVGIDDGYLLYRTLKDGIPSGDAYLEERSGGVASKVAGDLILEATRSPANPLRIAYIFAAGDGFGLAVADLSNGTVTRFRERDVLPDFLAWDERGSRVFFYEADQDAVVVVDRRDFEVRDEIPYALPSLRLAELETGRVRDAKGVRMPAGLPVLREATERPRPPAIAFTDEVPSTPEHSFEFELREPGGRRVLRGDDLTHASGVFVRSRDSAPERPVGEAKLVAALPHGGLFRTFSGNGSSLVVIDWDGNLEELFGTTTVVDFYLPMSLFVVAQGGGDYPPPGDCNLSTHSASSAASYAYDMFRSQLGAHIFASAPGLVVYTHSTTTCNSCDTGGDCPDRSSSCASNSGLGNTVTIEHADGSWTKYSHMQTGSIQVAVGAPVCTGRYLGNQGHTGCTFGYQCGDHLHFQRQASASLFADSTPITFVEHPSGPLACTSYSSAAFETSACGCQEPVIPLAVDATPYTDESCQGYSKVYSFLALSGVNYIVTLTPQSGNTDLYLSYSMQVSPSQSILESTALGTAVDQLQFTPKSSGTVYLAAYGVGPGTSSFTIHVTLGCEEPMRLLYVNAAPLLDDTCFGSSQRYSITAISGRQYTVTLTPQAGDTDLYLSPVFNVSPTQWIAESSEPGSTIEQIEYTPSATGPLYLAAHGVGPGTNSYTIQVARDCAEPMLSLEVNDVTSVVSICSGAAQLYSYSLLIGREYRVAVIPIQGDPDLYLHSTPDVSPTHFTYESSESGTAQEQISFFSEIDGESFAAVHCTPGPECTYGILVEEFCPVPTPPDGPSPAPEVTTCTSSLLSWAPSIGAESYDVTLNAVPICSGDETTCAPPSSLEPGLHNWQVVAHNDCGSQAGPFWSFMLLQPPTAPAPLTPSSGTLHCGTPELSWSHVASATSYSVFVDGIQRCETSLTGCNPGALDPGAHTWYVTANNICGSTPGPTSGFTVLEIPTAPANPVPEDGALLCESPTLAWAPSVGPSTYTTFVDGEQRCIGSTPGCDPGPIADGDHVWYVLQMNACGSSYGNLWWMTVDTTPPDTDAWEPLWLTWDGAAVRLDWGVVETASGYRVYRDSRPDSAWGTEQRLHPDPIPTTTWTDATATADIEFYLVTAVDDCGRERP